MGTALLKFAFVWGLCSLSAAFLYYGSLPSDLLHLRYRPIAFLGFVGAAAFAVVSLLWNDNSAGQRARWMNMLKFGGAWAFFAVPMLISYKTNAIEWPVGSPFRIYGTLQIQVSAFMGFIGAILVMAAYLAWKWVSRGKGAASDA